MDHFGSQLGETDSADWIFDYYETVASIIRIARAGARAVVVVSTCTEHTDPSAEGGAGCSTHCFYALAILFIHHKRSRVATI